MITVEFLKRQDHMAGFVVFGHAMLADPGLDVLCAAVSSAVQLTVNGITEILKYPVKVEALENKVALFLDDECQDAESFIEALRLHCLLLREDYPEHLSMKYREVE